VHLTVYQEDGPMRRAVEISLSDDDRQTLRKWARGRSTPARLVLRAKIVLAAADGKLNCDIAAELGTGMNQANWTYPGISPIIDTPPR
jgi:hypothetical protein